MLARAMAGATKLRVNGMDRTSAAPPARSLLSVLRDELDLTGAKYGCGEGQCGACTVLVDDRPVRSCITTLASAAGKSVSTIEGLARGAELHPLQQAFMDAGAMQCGYCVPGMIMAALGLLRRNPRPSDEEIVRGMQGNLCRCGTYMRTRDAVRRAAAQMGTRNSGGPR